MYIRAFAGKLKNILRTLAEKHSLMRQGGIHPQDVLPKPAHKLPDCDFCCHQKNAISASLTAEEIREVRACTREKSTMGN